MNGSVGFATMRSLSRDPGAVQRRLGPEVWPRVAAQARPFAGPIAVFVALVVVTPLLLRRLVDHGVARGDRHEVVVLALAVAGLALLEAVVQLVQRWFSARIGEGLILQLRRQVFSHVLRQPVAFFTRARTGALVQRLNTDVLGAQQAFTSTLAGVVSNTVQVVLVTATMLYLSWPITAAALVLLPVFLLPARRMGRRLQALSRETMQLNADLATRMTERFDVSGALLVKIFGDPAREDAEYAARAGRVRDIGVRVAMTNRVYLTALTLVASLALALVYGAGGLLAVQGTVSVGTLLALGALLGRLYAPITQLSTARIDVMTALVSFERVFEVLDLRPRVVEREGAVPVPAGPVDVRLLGVTYTHPGPGEVSSASLEQPGPGAGAGDGPPAGPVLRGVDLHVAPGETVALVGPSGAGKTTLAGLLARLDDPDEGQVLVGGVDLRDATLASVRAAVGVVSQDAHLFHDTIRANLAYAAPGADEAAMRRALQEAHVWQLVEQLPDGLDTVVGDRGHRLSGGEKQRIAVARLLLKAPAVVVLDEATAHLDGGSEAVVQRALDRALHGRTALVVAHRLSTVRDADRIVVLEAGRVVEQGTHDELLAADGAYAALHRAQFRTDAPAAP